MVELKAHAMAQMYGDGRRVLQRAAPVAAGSRGAVSTRVGPTGDLSIHYQVDGKEVVVAYELGNKVDVVLTADVDRGVEADILKYRYRVASMPTSVQKVEQVFVRNKSEVVGISGPNGWLVRKDEWFGWSALGNQRLEPGREQDGLVVAARWPESLPGVVECVVRGQVRAAEFPGGTPDALGALMPEFPLDAVGGRTVGPVRRPLGLTPTEWIGILEQYVREASEEGWIQGDAVKAGYGERLRRLGVMAASREVRREEGRAMLLELVEAVQVDRVAERLTSEGYGVLKYNLEALRSAW